MSDIEYNKALFAKKSEVAALLKEARTQHEAGQGTGFWAVYTSQDKLVPGAFSFAARPVGEDPAVADETIENLIWGIGTTPDEARQAAAIPNDGIKDFLLEPGTALAMMTKELYEAVEQEGGGVPFVLRDDGILDLA